MWSLFKPPRFSDPLLGEFLRSRRYWRGAVKLDDSVVPLILAGDRTEPNLSALVLARSFEIEFGLTAAWDEEHQLGARFREGRFVELCGSVLPP